MSESAGRVHAWCETCGHHQRWHRNGTGECCWIFEPYLADPRPCDQACSKFELGDAWIPIT